VDLTAQVNVILETSESHRAMGRWRGSAHTDKSRVVYIQLGHDRIAQQNPDYQELVHRAVLWAGGTARLIGGRAFGEES
jgi:type 1 glutamine amidotransferase